MNHYRAVIRILANKRVNLEALITEIAIHNPAAVTAAYARLNTSSTLESRCKALMLAGEKIKAIKLWREETGSSLAEAKNAVERL